jgi:hypothetical protein
MEPKYTPSGIASGCRSRLENTLMPTTVDPQRLSDLLASPRPPRLLDVRTLVDRLTADCRPESGVAQPCSR